MILTSHNKDFLCQDLDISHLIIKSFMPYLLITIQVYYFIFLNWRLYSRFLPLYGEPVAYHCCSNGSTQAAGWKRQKKRRVPRKRRENIRNKTCKITSSFFYGTSSLYSDVNIHSIDWKKISFAIMPGR